MSGAVYGIIKLSSCDNIGVINFSLDVDKSDLVSQAFRSESEFEISFCTRLSNATIQRSEIDFK